MPRFLRNKKAPKAPEIAIPPELRKAHQNNDRAVMQAYGFDVATTTETSCVAELMRMYQKLTEKEGWQWTMKGWKNEQCPRF